MGSAKRGIQGAIYRNTGTYGAPVWDLVDIVGDVTVGGSWDYAEGNTRQSRIKRGKKTLVGIEVTADVQVIDDHTDYIAIDDSFVEDTPLDLLILNGPKDQEGVHGWRADFCVTDFGEEQPLGGLIMRKATLKPELTANVPKRAKVGTGGTLAFTDPGVAA